MQDKLSCALYIRLSKEDERNGPSESVTNQRAMLEQYSSDNGLSVFDVYVDDGWSGCNFDRPAFQRMLADIESGHVNMVITKDLSRLGRDYILIGYYLERYFPEHAVRYVSLLDGIDTGSDTLSNDITPFRAIMNDMYARDISRKITSVKRNKQQRGDFIGGKPMFGYRKHPTEKNRIVIDKKAADVVKRIFMMALGGTSCRGIAQLLNSEGIPSPSVYAQRTTTGEWNGERIGEMLRSEIYVGNMVQGRRVKVSYKSKRSIHRKREDWIVVEGTHDAIIDRSTFDAVQRILESRSRTRTRTYDFPLKGLVFCKECGHPLGVVNRKNSRGEDTLYFVCRTYQRSTKEKRCSAHCVKVKSVTDAVKSLIYKECTAENIASCLEGVAEHFFRKEMHSRIGERLHELLEQQNKINIQIDKLCLDRLAGLVEQQDFDRLYHHLCTQRTALEEKRAGFDASKAPEDAALRPDKLAAKYIAGIGNDREILSQLVERIELSEQREMVIVFRVSHSE